MNRQKDNLVNKGWIVAIVCVACVNGRGRGGVKRERKMVLAI